MAFRFGHTADIHLNSPLKSLALRNPQLSALVGNATRRAFEYIVDTSIDEKLDALLICGDLYDGAQTSMETAKFIGRQTRRLHEAGVRIFVIRGNHDAESVLTRELEWPDSATRFDSEGGVEMITDRGGRSIALHGLSFAKPHAPASLLSKYKPPVPDAINLGLMHTSVEGAEGHSLYAPCSLNALHGAGMDYWALGHVHKRWVEKGTANIVMPGMPQGRDIGEAGPKSFTIVSIGDDRQVHIEERVTSVAQFERVVIDLTGEEDWRRLFKVIASALDGAREACVSEHLIMRLELIGSTDLAWRIRHEADLLRTSVEEHTEATGTSWIEKIDIRCQKAEAASPSDDDPVSELMRIIRGTTLDSHLYKQELDELITEIRGQLPPECRHTFGDTEEAVAQMRTALAQEGAEAIIARLQSTLERGQ